MYAKLNVPIFMLILALIVPVIETDWYDTELGEQIQGYLLAALLILGSLKFIIGWATGEVLYDEYPSMPIGSKIFIALVCMIVVGYAMSALITSDIGIDEPYPVGEDGVPAHAFFYFLWAGLDAAMSGDIPSILGILIFVGLFVYVVFLDK